MQLSVVILNYNVRYFLELCLHSVFASIQNLEAEVIVVDNNSPDDSCKMVKEKFPEAKLIQNKENLGFAKANNQAVNIAKGKYVCILNPDTVVCEDTFENCLQKISSISNLGILGVQLIDGSGHFLPESKRNLPTPKVSLFKIFGKRFSFLAPYYAEHVQKNENGKVSVLVGAFMFCETEKYTKLNGFDEQYFMYGEDIDFSYTFTLAGYNNYYFGESQIVHFKGESSFKNEVYRERFFGAMRLFFQKHFKTSWFSKQAVFLGIKLASLLSFKKSDATKMNFSKVIVVTSNHKIVQKIGKALNLASSKIELGEIEKFRNTNEYLLCVLDMEFISFKKAISVISAFSETNIYFRFKPKNEFFALGSDSSSTLGNVIFF